MVYDKRLKSPRRSRDKFSKRSRPRTSRAGTFNFDRVLMRRPHYNIFLTTHKIPPAKIPVTHAYRKHTFQRRMPALQQRVETLLEKGAQFDGPLGGKCREILKHKEHLWTFVQDPHVDPTNNFAERAVRQGVLWRKGSFGTQSERGARYVERMLTVCATCRLQKRSIIDYLRHACHNHRKGITVPSLLSKIVNFQKIA